MMKKAVFLLILPLLCSFALAIETTGVDYSLPYSSGSFQKYSWNTQDIARAYWDGGATYQGEALFEITNTGSGNKLLPGNLRNPVFERNIEGLELSYSQESSPLTLTHLNHTCVEVATIIYQAEIAQAYILYLDVMDSWLSLRHTATACQESFRMLNLTEILADVECLAHIEAYELSEEPLQEIITEPNNSLCEFTSEVLEWENFTSIETDTFLPPNGEFAILLSWTQDRGANSFNPDVSACATLTTNNTVYTQNESVNITGADCWIASGLHNITFDGGGHNTNISQDVAFTSAFLCDNCFNVTVKNMVIAGVDGLAADWGIQITNTNLVNITNNTDTTSSISVYVDTVEDLTITLNYFSDNIDLDDITRGTITNNNFSGFDADGVTINLTSKSNENSASISGSASVGSSGNLYNCAGTTTSLTRINTMARFNVTHCKVSGGVVAVAVNPSGTSDYLNTTITGGVISLDIASDGVNMINTTITNNATNCVRFSQFGENANILGLNCNYTGDTIAVHFAAPADGENNMIDCQGGLIEGNRSAVQYGVSVNDENTVNMTLQNCLIENFERGVYLNRHTEPQIFINLTTSENNYGIYLEGADNQTFNTIHLNSDDFVGIEQVAILVAIAFNHSNNNVFTNVTGTSSPGNPGSFIRQDRPGEGNTYTNVSGTNDAGAGVTFFSAFTDGLTNAVKNVFDCQGGELIGDFVGNAINVDLGSDDWDFKNCTILNWSIGILNGGISQDNNYSDITIKNTATGVVGDGANTGLNSFFNRITITNSTNGCVLGSFRNINQQLYDISCNNSMVVNGGYCVNLNPSVPFVRSWDFFGFDCRAGTNTDGFKIERANRDTNTFNGTWSDGRDSVCIGQGTDRCFDMGAGDNNQVHNFNISLWNTGIFIGSVGTGGTYDNNDIRNTTVGIDVSDAGSTGNSFESNFLCDNTLDLDDQDAATWTGNSCNSTAGSATCDIIINATCPLTPVVDVRWILIKATPIWHILFKTDGSERIILRI